MDYFLAFFALACPWIFIFLAIFIFGSKNG
jgi:hypothetical protein